MSGVLTPITRRSRVLVVDDTESVRSLFRRLLSGDGHDVISADDATGRTSSCSMSICRRWTASRSAAA
jgi:CheY-like chemotaxis protein